MKMKKFKRLFIVTVVLIAFGCTTMMAQQMPPIPVDPNVKVGKLSNGLTYYIRKNTLPEHKAFFYIAQKVGSIQEEKNQRGLAHFLEHMCFNGSKHFPGNRTISYLESIGVKFGYNLNAYTSVEETVYNIDNVPVTTPGAIDSCIMMLHDWSNDLTLDPKEIDKERGVIQGEWRMGRDANQRLFEKMQPVIFAGSKYNDCDPIGTMDVVMKFKPQTLRDYYEKWYRPDLQGVVIVGDIDPAEIEAKIKKIFADIPAQPNAAKRVYFDIPSNKEPIVFVGTDKEQPNIGLSLMFKRAGEPDSMKTNMMYMIEQYAIDAVSRMLNDRLDEIKEKATCPFADAGFSDGNYIVARNENAFTANVSLKENDIEGGIASVYREVLRAKKFGFTASEYARTRTELLREYESLYNERDKQESNKFVQKYVRNFLDSEPMPSIEQEFGIMNQIAPNIPVEMINQMVGELIPDSNMVAVYISPEKEGLKVPTQEDILGILNKVKAENIEAYVDKVSNEPLMTTFPQAGTIKSTKVNPKTGNTEMVLSNGARVIIKTTDFKKDELTMEAISKGGSSLYPESGAIDYKELNAVASLGGVGKFSKTDLQKMLAGKLASAQASVGLNNEDISASCSPKDLETMMQLVYLRFTAPRKDMEAFESYKTRTKAELKNQELEPQMALVDSLYSSLYNNNPRLTRVKAADIDKIDYDHILKIYKERFADASDFTFIFVGNATADTLRPFIEKYIASLPGKGVRENSRPFNMIRKGIYTCDFLKEQQTPASTILKIITGKETYNQRTDILTDILWQVFNELYLKTIREEASISYAPGAVGEMRSFPEPISVIQIQVPTSPENKDKALKLIQDGIDQIVKQGPEAEALNKAKEYLIKQHADNVKKNSYWTGNILTQVLHDFDADVNYEKNVNSVTAKEVQAFAAGLCKQNNCVTVVMTSKTAK